MGVGTGTVRTCMVSFDLAVMGVVDPWIRLNSAGTG